MSKSVPSHHRDVARVAAETFGGGISVKQCWDAAENSMIAILIAEDSPAKNLKSYSTIGLCDSEIHDHSGPLPFRAEFAMTAQTHFEKAGNILATAAFHVINSGWSCHCFALYPGVVEMYYSESPMKHLLFVDPFMWDDAFPDFQIGELPVQWLLAIPISESERRYAINFRIPTLLDELDECGADFTDLERSPVV
jgi:antitoxin YqcF